MPGAGADGGDLRRHAGAVNDPELTERVAKTLKHTLGDANVVEGEPSMGGEDFSRYGLAGVPICMFRLGAVNQKRLDEFAAQKVPPPSLHSPLFYPDAEETLTVGVPAMASRGDGFAGAGMRRRQQRGNEIDVHGAPSDDRSAGCGCGARVTWCSSALVVWSLFSARHWAIAELATPKSIADWQAWREDVEQQQEHPGPVQRRVPKSDEPPALVLMRDYFGVSLTGAVLFSTVLYWIMAWFVTGTLTASPTSKQNVS